MPYITVNTALTLTVEQRETVKAELGKLIPIIPTKSERTLMIDFSDSRPMYMGGNPLESGAFVEVRLFGKADLEAKKQFVQQVFHMMEHVLGIKENEMYLNILELEQWGSGGILK